MKARVPGKRGEKRIGAWLEVPSAPKTTGRKNCFQELFKGGMSAERGTNFFLKMLHNIFQQCAYQGHCKDKWIYKGCL